MASTTAETLPIRSGPQVGHRRPLRLAQVGTLFALASFPALGLAAAPKGSKRAFPPPVIPSESELASVDVLLKDGKGQPALESLQALVRRNLETPRALGLATALGRLAVAELSLGREDEARWHWAVAQGLSPSPVAAADLASLGAAGARVAAWSMRSLTEVPPGVSPLGPAAGDFQPPHQKSVAIPEMDAGLPLDSGPKWLQVQLIVDADGRPRDPIANGPSERFAYQLLEEMRFWRFEPARKGGEAVPALYLLTINAPRGKPMSEMLGGVPELLKLEERLRTGVDGALARYVEDRWRKSVDEGQFPYNVQAALLLLRAVAWVATGKESDGICFAQAAQALNPALFDADLSPYGAAGATLERSRFGAARAARPVRVGRFYVGETIEKPELVHQTKPEYTVRARRSRWTGEIFIGSVIDETGAVRDPLPFDAGPQLSGLDFTVLEAVCQWHFAPSRRAGSPVPVYYELSVHFDIQRSPF